ncbi:hypothetical protein [Candidatus Tisiphia endosymbiont of Hybos culiciformis]|uniref:hypothetical protein n=1 Tax=Candidatus Tisiphia endosymbiont of Hybos culiciformis TaxID=3139331 RepID=UPI003CCA83C4
MKGTLFTCAYIANPVSICPFASTRKMSFPHRRESSVGCHFCESRYLDSRLRGNDKEVCRYIFISIFKKYSN